VTDRSDGFAVTLLLPVMFLGEMLEIRGHLSPKLLSGMEQYQRNFYTWFPRHFQLVEFIAKDLVPLSMEKSHGSTGTAFSGGIDSFFTLWSNLPQNQSDPTKQISHGLFVQGFDIRLEDLEEFDLVAQRNRDLFISLDLTLLTARTNARMFSQFMMSWLMAHGGPLIGTALNLSPLLGRFYVPATLAHHQAKPEGTTQLTDPLFSTERTEIIHFGATHTRYEKLKIISDWPPTYNHLIVCVDHEVKGLENCGRCKKCMRTMTSLGIIGVLEKYSTFKMDLSFSSFLNWAIKQNVKPLFERETLKQAYSARRVDITIGLVLVLLIGTIRMVFKETTISLIPPKWAYQIRKRIYRPMIDPYSYEN
jgi:hypothetical protein